MQFVKITHPEVGNPAVVSVRAAAAFAAKGWQLEDIVEDPRAALDEGPAELKRPQKNDSTAAWRTWAVAAGGLTVTEAFAKSRDDLVKLYSTGEDGQEMPARNASTEVWRAYAVDHGMNPDEAAALGRDELAAHFDTKEF